MTLDYFDKKNKKILEKKVHIPKIYKRNSEGLKKRNCISVFWWKIVKKEMEEKRELYNKIKKRLK